MALSPGQIVVKHLPTAGRSTLQTAHPVCRTYSMASAGFPALHREAIAGNLEGRHGSDLGAAYELAIQ